MEIVVEFALIDQLGMIRIDRLNFDGDFQVSPSVDGLIYFSEGSFLNFPNYFETLSDLLQWLWHERINI